MEKLYREEKTRLISQSRRPTTSNDNLRNAFLQVTANSRYSKAEFAGNRYVVGQPWRSGGAARRARAAGAALKVADAEKTRMCNEALRGRKNKKAVILGIEAGGRIHKHFLPSFSRSASQMQTSDLKTITKTPPWPRHTRKFSRVQSFLSQVGYKSHALSGGRTNHAHHLPAHQTVPHSGKSGQTRFTTCNLRKLSLVDIRMLPTHLRAISNI